MAGVKLSLLDDSGVAYLYNGCLDVLRGTGVRVGSAKARQLLERAGCRVDHDTERVWFASDVLEWTISKMDRQVLLAAREPEKDANLDGSRTYSTTTGVCPWVIDKETGRHRQPSLADLSVIGRIVDALDEVGVVWFPITPTLDAPSPMTDLATLACLLADTSKHIQGQILRPEQVGPALELVALAAPRGDIRQRPIFSSLYCPVSPLTHDSLPMEAAMAMARECVPLDIFSLPLSGGTAPMSLAGCIIQNTCETLSAAAVFKLVEEDCPLVFSVNCGIMDMRTAAFSTSAPEVLLMNIAQMELAHRLHAPTLSVGYQTDSYALGFRAGLDDMAQGLVTNLLHPDILIGFGAIESAQTLSVRKLVLDAELDHFHQRLAKGITTGMRGDDIDVIRSVGPGGNFLDRPETVSSLRAGEHWIPDVLRRSAYSEWEAGDSDEIERAQARADDILANHIPLPLPAGAEEAMHRVLQDAGADATCIEGLRSRRSSAIAIR
jgi:trimethylamine--corrinoid protein Co-methyltransferase